MLTKTLALVSLALALGCGGVDPGADMGSDASPDAGLDASSDASPLDATPDMAEDATRDAEADAVDMGPDPCADALPSIVSLTWGDGPERVARVETRCFTPPITRVEVFVRDPRTELATLEGPLEEDTFDIPIAGDALGALPPGTYEVGVSVTSSAETLSQERLATLEVPE